MASEVKADLQTSERDNHDDLNQLETSNSDGEESTEDGEIDGSEENGKSTTEKDLAGPLSAYKEQLVKSNNVQSDHDDAPPLPDEAPPLPAEAPPAATQEDDGWAPVWDETAQAFYFYNRFTSATQWSNPRVPEATFPEPSALTASSSPAIPSELAPVRAAGGYDPAIHGDYDATAWYAQTTVAPEPQAAMADPATAYTATAAFNRFTGRYQAADITPENYNDENKSKRQMNAFFDVDAAANNHNGKSLKEERSGKKLSKQELKQFKEKRKAKKEEKRRAWLRD